MQRLLVTTQTTKTSYPSRLRAAFSCARGIIGQMRFRKLRIAFSATCLIACVLLIALWVRSYWWFDRYRTDLPPLHRGIGIDSVVGCTGIIVENQVSNFAWTSSWTHDRILN